MSFGAKEIPNQPKWNPEVYNFNIPHKLALIESLNLICVADRENGIVQCFNSTNGFFEYSIPVPSNLKKVYAIDADNEKKTLAILGKNFC